MSKQQTQIGTFIRVAGAVGPFRPTINLQAIDCGGVIHQDRDLITILVPAKSLFSLDSLVGGNLGHVLAGWFAGVWWLAVQSHSGSLKDPA